MKKICGFILFWIGIGMLLMLVLTNRFLGIMIIGLLLLGGYNLYCCK